MSRFLSWPFVTHVHLENGVSEARDLLAAERNYLTGIRSSFTVTVAASAIILQTNVFDQGDWIDWVLTGVLLTIALLLPAVSVVNYSGQLNSVKQEQAALRNTMWLFATLLATALCAVIVAIREYLKPETHVARFHR